MRIAFVFPGQGSQSVGMLSGFADNAVVADYMARANAALGRSCQTHRRRSGGSAQPDGEHAARTARGLCSVL